MVDAGTSSFAPAVGSSFPHMNNIALSNPVNPYYADHPEQHARRNPYDPAAQQQHVFWQQAMLQVRLKYGQAPTHPGAYQARQAPVGAGPSPSGQAGAVVVPSNVLSQGSVTTAQMGTSNQPVGHGKMSYLRIVLFMFSMFVVMLVRTSSTSTVVLSASVPGE